MSINLSDLPKLTDRSTYTTWRVSIQALFLILDLADTIAPPSTSPSTSTLSNPSPTTDQSSPQPSLQLATSSPTSTSLTTQQDEQGEGEEDEWHNEQRRRDDKAVGWMFMTMEPRFASEVLREMGLKRDAEGGLQQVKELGMNEVVARDLWVYLEKAMN